MLSRDHIVKYLNDLLQPSLFKDSTHNGLQVEGKEKIERVGFAVDSSIEIFRKAAEKQCEMLVVHHGLIWGGLKKITGYQRERLALLLSAGINLYVSHLPLDKHPVLGHNARIAGELGGRAAGEIGEAGIVVDLKKAVTFDRLLAASKELFGQDVRSLNYGAGKIGRIAVCSGAVQLSFLQEAADRGIDTVLTGEGMGEGMFLYPAREGKMNVIFAGHTRTETLGILALLKKLKKDLGEKVETFNLQIEG